MARRRNSAAMFRIPIALSLALMTLQPVAAQENASVRKEIDRCYQKAAFGAELKFVDGMLSNRAQTYEVYAPNGKQVDLSSERGRFEETFQPATRVKLETQIVKLEPFQSAWLCTVEQTLRVETVGPAGLQNQKIHTLLVDIWQKTGDGWRILKTQVLRQEFGSGEGFPDEYLQPTTFVKKNKPAAPAGKTKK